MGSGTEFCPPNFAATRRKGPCNQQRICRHHVRIHTAARRLRSFRGDTMKNKSIFTLIGLVLFCAAAVAQESQQTATASAPYAGATISDFKGKVSIQLPAQVF